MTISYFEPVTLTNAPMTDDLMREHLRNRYPDIDPASWTFRTESVRKVAQWIPFGADRPRAPAPILVYRDDQGLLRWWAYRLREWRWFRREMRMVGSGAERPLRMLWRREATSHNGHVEHRELVTA